MIRTFTVNQIVIKLVHLKWQMTPLQCVYSIITYKNRINCVDTNIVIVLGVYRPQLPLYYIYE